MDSAWRLSLLEDLLGWDIEIINLTTYPDGREIPGPAIAVPEGASVNLIYGGIGVTGFSPYEMHSGLGAYTLLGGSGITAIDSVCIYRRRLRETQQDFERRVAVGGVSRTEYDGVGLRVLTPQRIVTHLPTSSISLELYLIDVVSAEGRNARLVFDSRGRVMPAIYTHLHEKEYTTTEVSGLSARIKRSLVEMAQPIVLQMLNYFHAAE